MKFDRERMLHLAQITVRVLVLPVACAVSYGTKSHVPMALGLLALAALLSGSRIRRIGSRFQGSEEERAAFKKIVLRSVILAPIIVIAFIAIVLVIMRNS